MKLLFSLFVLFVLSGCSSIPSSGEMAPVHSLPTTKKWNVNVYARLENSPTEGWYFTDFTTTKQINRVNILNYTDTYERNTTMKYGRDRGASCAVNFWTGNSSDERCLFNPENPFKKPKQTVETIYTGAIANMLFIPISLGFMASEWYHTYFDYDELSNAILQAHSNYEHERYNIIKKLSIESSSN